MEPLIRTITCLPAAFVTATAMMRFFVLRAVALEISAGETVMVKVRLAPAKVAVAACVAVIVAVPAASAESVEPEIAAIAGLLDV